MGALLQLATVFAAWVMAEANEIHRKLRIRFIILIAVMALAIGLNFFAWGRVINYLLMVVVTFMAINITTKPNFIFTIAGLGALSKITSPIAGAEKTLKIARDVVCRILLLANLFLFFAGFLDFSNNPGGLIVVIGGAILLLWMEISWKYKPVFIKPISYACTILVVGFHLGSFLPEVLWYKTVGRNPYHATRYTKAEEALAKADGRSAESFDEKLAKEIKVISAKQQNGTATAADNASLKAIRQEIQDKAILSRAKRAITLAKTTSDTPAPGSTRVFGPGTYNLPVNPGSETGSVVIADGCTWNLAAKAPGKYDLLLENGEVIEFHGNGSKHAKFPNQFIAYKLRAIDPVVLELKVNRRVAKFASL